MRRLLPVLLIVFAAAAPSARAATTVRVGDFYPSDPIVQPGVLVTDETGDPNVLTVSYTYEPSGQIYPPGGNADVTIEDTSAALEPGEGCTRNGNTRVRCRVDGLLGIGADLGGASDSASAQSPSGGQPTCRCVRLLGGAGNDALTSSDGAQIDGGEGDDVLTGAPSSATAVPHGLGGVNDDGLFGGPGDDTLDAGIGDDALVGGSGEDVLRGGDGADRMVGGDFSPPQGPQGLNPPAGRDNLDGGTGADVLDDGDDASTEIGADTLIGGSGVDTINSYMDREAGVDVDLSEAGRQQGQAGEGDTLVNVEAVYGGRGDDVLVGDGDANQLLGFAGGSDRMRGRGGDDFLLLHGARRADLRGDRGDDRIELETGTRGSVACGRGTDRVVQPERNAPESPRRPSENDAGATVAPSCEAISRPGGWGIDPVPDRPVSATRRLTFDRPPGTIARKRFSLTVTSTSRPYKTLAMGTSRARGITVRLPKAIARQARRRGMAFRAEVHEDFFGPRLQLVWRFRVKPAR